jgi:hypothetical protein
MYLRPWPTTCDMKLKCEGLVGRVLKFVTPKSQWPITNMFVFCFLLQDSSHFSMEVFLFEHEDKTTCIAHCANLRTTGCALPLRYEHIYLIRIMGLIHTPRTIYSIMNGVYKRQLFFRQHPPTSIASNGIPKNTLTVGLEPSNPHIYQARLGLFDIDYLGHMNNGMLFWIDIVLWYKLPSISRITVWFLFLRLDSRLFNSCRTSKMGANKLQWYVTDNVKAAGAFSGRRYDNTIPKRNPTDVW